MLQKGIIIGTVFCMLLYLGSCGDSSAQSGDLALGEEVYTKYCVLCHGDDGKKEFNGAKDITVSELTYKERVILVKEGRNLMTPFNGILSDEEIEAVAAFTSQL